jgi:hypothetical protein
LPETVKKADVRGFAMDVKLIAKPLMGKTQAKRLRQLGAASLLERRARDARPSEELSKLPDAK